MFLWARLQIDLLSDNAFASGDLMTTLDVVPKPLSDM
jgi:hypothetical protein